MGTLRSTQNWTGRDLGGVILGEPVMDESTGEFVWDHPAIPGDQIDSNGDVWQEVDDAQAPA